MALTAVREAKSGANNSENLFSSQRELKQAAMVAPSKLALLLNRPMAGAQRLSLVQNAGHNLGNRQVQRMLSEVQRSCGCQGSAKADSQNEPSQAPLEVQRSCGCGQAAEAGAEECAPCQKNKAAMLAKEAPPDGGDEPCFGEQEETAQERPAELKSDLKSFQPAQSPKTEAATTYERPHDDSATIVCDGKGGYRVSLGWAENATCGIKECVRGHEQSHANDWKKRWPKGCKDKPDGGDIPLGGPGYDEFLKASECRSYTGEVPCGQKLLKKATGDCKDTVKEQLDTWKSRKASYCS